MQKVFFFMNVNLMPLNQPVHPKKQELRKFIKMTIRMLVYSAEGNRKHVTNTVIPLLNPELWFYTFGSSDV